MAINITENNFEELVSKSEKPVLLDFWAEWCGPCRMIAPIIDELHNEFEGKAVIGKVNVDESASISSKYGIRNIPTLLFIKDGEVVDKHVGSASKEDLSQKLTSIL